MIPTHQDDVIGVQHMMANEEPVKMTPVQAGIEKTWLFRTVVSASMYADLRMVPHESALFSRDYKLTSLWGRPISDHCEGVCTSGAVVCPLRVAPARRSEG